MFQTQSLPPFLTNATVYYKYMKYLVVVGCQATKCCNVLKVQYCMASPNHHL